MDIELPLNIWVDFGGVSWQTYKNLKNSPIWFEMGTVQTRLAGEHSLFDSHEWLLIRWVLDLFRSWTSQWDSFVAVQ